MVRRGEQGVGKQGARVEVGVGVASYSLSLIE